MNKFKSKWLVVVLAGCLVIGGCMGARAASNDYIATVEEASTSGWIADDETHVWTLMSTSTSASADVHCVYVNADVTGYIGANMKVRLEDDGVVKYFGILSLGSYVDGVTPVYLFGGTDYVLSGAITEFSYSSMRSPFGWPMNKNKWEIDITDSSYRSNESPTINTWINVGGANHQIIIPAGLWNVEYEAFVSGVASVSYMGLWATLSDASSTQSNSNFTDAAYVSASSSTAAIIGVKMHGKDMIDLSSETTYYLNIFMSSPYITTLEVGGNTIPTKIMAVWGGL